jgi:anaerobic magnesium-protoporphyrin IX monomethyl ester cyclase
MRIALIGAEVEESLATRYIWSSLERAGHDVVHIVFNYEEDLENAARELARSRAAIAGFSMVFTYRAREFAKLALRARQLGFSGHICAGGHFATFNAENLLCDEPAFDSVGCGEGEQIMVDLAAGLDDLSRVRGLVWRRADGKICRNEPALKPSDLDAFPPPARKSPPDRFLGMPIVNLLASRGCTHHCVFCSIVAWHRVCGGERLRQRSVAQVADEMSRLYSQGVRLFNFQDDNFFSPGREQSFARFRSLEKELRLRRVGRIGFAIKARPDDLDEEILRYLKEMGLFRVFLGIEAGTDESLNRLGRGQTLDDNDRALSLVNSLNIHVCFNLLLLNPDSTLEDVDANVRFLRTHPRNPMNFCRTEIYSGTPLEAKLRREGRLLGSYWGYDYVIADPRAQLVFELIYPAFSGRIFGEPCVQHTAMAVDYERQILDHFFGCPSLLGQRIRQFIVDINLNTCDYLAEFIDIARSGFATTHQRQLFMNELHHRLASDNERFHRKGAELLSQVRSRAEEPQGRSHASRMKLTAAKAALLASVAIAPAGATPGSGPWAAEMAPRPPADTIPASAHQELKEKLLPIVVKRLESPAPVKVEIIVDYDRRTINSCRAKKGDLSFLNIFEAKGITLKQWLPLGSSNVYSDSFTADEVAAAMKANPAAPRPESPTAAESGIRLSVLQFIRSSIQSQDIKFVLWFGPTGTIAGADLSEVKASSEDETRLRAVLFDRFRAENKELAGKCLSFSYKAYELRPTQMFEMAPRPPQN